MPPTDENPERPWREVRAEMVKRLGSGGAYGYLAYVDDPERGDPGHYRGPRHLYEDRGFEPVEVRDRDTVMRRPTVID